MNAPTRLALVAGGLALVACLAALTSDAAGHWRRVNDPQHERTPDGKYPLHSYPDEDPEPDPDRDHEQEEPDDGNHDYAEPPWQRHESAPVPAPRFKPYVMIPPNLPPLPCGLVPRRPKTTQRARSRHRERHHGRGRRGADDDHDNHISPYIIGGNTAAAYSHPSMVVVRDNMGTLKCGGVLLTDTLFISSATCMEKANKSWHVSLGHGDGLEIYKLHREVDAVCMSTKHDSANPDSTDWAVVQMSGHYGMVGIDPAMQPACLPRDAVKPAAQRKPLKGCVMPGWGVSSFSKPTSKPGEPDHSPVGTFPAKLQNLLVDEVACDKKYEDPSISCLKPSAGQNPNATSCLSDEGSPILCHDPSVYDGDEFVEGIVMRHPSNTCNRFEQGTPTMMRFHRLDQIIGMMRKLCNSFEWPTEREW